MKYFGNSLQSSGNRLYKRLNRKEGEKYILISWMDKHCVICGRFINKRSDNIYCRECARKLREIYYKKWKEEHLEQQREYHRNYLREWRKRRCG